MVDTRVGDDDESGLLEGTGDVVGEITGCETTSDRLGTSVCRELQDCTLTVRAGRNDTDIMGVLNRSNHTSREDNLLPGLADVNDIDTLNMLSRCLCRTNGITHRLVSASRRTAPCAYRSFLSQCGIEQIGEAGSPRLSRSGQRAIS